MTKIAPYSTFSGSPILGYSLPNENVANGFVGKVFARKPTLLKQLRMQWMVLRGQYIAVENMICFHASLNMPEPLSSAFFRKLLPDISSRLHYRPSITPLSLPVIKWPDSAKFAS
jgi:hypothetical protein